MSSATKHAKGLSPDNRPEESLAKCKRIEEIIAKSEKGDALIPYHRVALAIWYFKSTQFIAAQCSEHIDRGRIPSESLLQSGRSYLDRGVISLETLGMTSFDAAIGDDEEQESPVSALIPPRIYGLHKVFDHSFECLIDVLHSRETVYNRFRWNLNALHGRFLVIIYNVLNIRILEKAIRDTTMLFREELIQEGDLLIERIDQVALGYLEQYSSSDMSVQYIRSAIDYTDALRHLQISLLRSAEAEESKRRIEAYQQRLNNDLRSKDGRRR